MSSTTAQAPRRARPQTVLEVVETSWLTPHMVRVVAGGDGFAAFTTNEYTDKYVKIFFAKPELGLEPPYDVAALRETLAPEDLPVTRTYTVRWVDEEAGRLAIDFVVHGDEGLAGPWAAAAKPGDRIVFAGPGGLYAPDPTADRHLLVGDDSAIPAIAAAVEALSDSELDERVAAGTLKALKGVGDVTAGVVSAVARGEVPAYLTRLEEADHDSLAVEGGETLRRALRGDLHTHSDWSDGGSPIAEMAQAARDLGHAYIALTDHSPRLTVANGRANGRVHVFTAGLERGPGHIEHGCGHLHGDAGRSGEDGDLVAERACDYQRHVSAHTRRPDWRERPAGHHPLHLRSRRSDHDLGDLRNGGHWRSVHG